jgi:hypothetical protein
MKLHFWVRFNRGIPNHLGFLALFAGDTGEIKAEVREQIDVKGNTRCVFNPGLSQLNQDFN